MIKKKVSSQKKSVSIKKKEAKTPSQPKEKSSPKNWMSWLTVLLWAAVAGCVGGALFGWILAQFLHVPQVDLLAEFEPAATTRIYAANGEQVASYALEQTGRSAPGGNPRLTSNRRSSRSRTPTSIPTAGSIRRRSSAPPGTASSIAGSARAVAPRP